LERKAEITKAAAARDARKRKQQPREESILEAIKAEGGESLSGEMPFKEADSILHDVNKRLKDAGHKALKKNALARRISTFKNETKG